MSLLISVQVESGPLTWPLQTLTNGKGNSLAVASLACFLNNLIGNSSVILREGSEVVCLLFCEGRKPVFWNCRTGVKLDVDVDAFHQSGEIQQQLGIDGSKAE